MVGIGEVELRVGLADNKGELGILGLGVDPRELTELGERGERGEAGSKMTVSDSRLAKLMKELGYFSEASTALRNASTSSLPLTIQPFMPAKL